VLVGGVNQKVAFVSEGTLVFVVSIATELGLQPMVITTPVGQFEMEVEVVPPPPKLGQITPSPIVLGGLVNIQGSHLEAVTEVTMGGLPCEVTAQTDAIIVFIAPLSHELIGTSQLMIASENGFDVDDVMAQAAPPVIDSMTPNPVRAGDLLTIHGAILNWNLSAEVAGLEAVVMEVEDGRMVVQVPANALVGPREVKVFVGATASDPAGPLHITAAEFERPNVISVIPSTVTEGGVFWLVGDALGDVDAVSQGLEILSCAQRQCAISSQGLPPGSANLSVSSPDGTDVFSLTVEADDAPVLPLITEVTPIPAFRGETITIRGSDLFEVNAVVISGQSHVIDYVSAEEVIVTVHPETAMGGESLFVAGHAGSTAYPVGILEHFGTGDEGDDAGGDAPSSELSGPDVPTVTGGTTGGCTAASPTTPLPWALTLMFLTLYGLFRTKRNSRFPLGPARAESTAPTSVNPEA
jgi:hypothetical protein